MTYSAAVIGCGRAGFSYDLDPKRKEIYSHLGGYSKSDRIANLIAVDENEQTLSLVEAKFPNVRLYKSAKEMFRNESVDIVSIATPTKKRENLIDLAIKHNVKSIFCEKPLSISLGSAIRIARACESKNISLAVNHFRRWDKLHIDVADYLKSGNLGTIQCVSIKYNNGVLNTGSHVFDLLRMFFGEITSVRTLPHNSLSDRPGDPTLSVIVKFQSGLFADLIGCDSQFFRIFEIDIIGTKGRIVIDNGYNMAFYVLDASPHNSEFKILRPRPAPFTGGRRFHYEDAVSNMIGSIEGGEKILCDGNDGFKSLEASIAAWLSYCRREEVVLPLDERYFSIEVQDV